MSDQTNIKKSALDIYKDLYKIEISDSFYEKLPQVSEEANAGLNGAVSIG